MIGEGVVSVQEDRVSALSGWPMPAMKCQLKRFLGTVGYYRKFVPGFVSSAAVLTPMTARGSPDKLVWTSEGESTFNEFKQCLCCSVKLCVPRLSDRFVLYTDASANAIGACLHVDREGEERPVAFFSRGLRGPEVRYSVSEKEALAVVEAVNHFDVYLFGQEVEVRTDHRPNLALTSRSSVSDLNPRLRRFSLKLQGRVKMSYTPGVQLENADGFSRMMEVEDAEKTESAEIETRRIDTSPEGGVEAAVSGIGIDFIDLKGGMWSQAAPPLISRRK